MAQEQKRTASDAEIRSIIESIAAAARTATGGHFFDREIVNGLKQQGISPKSVDWMTIINNMYHTDYLASSTRFKPYNANDAVIKPEVVGDVTLGVPDLGVAHESTLVINAGYRRDGRKSGGISEQPPKDLRTNE